MPAVRRRDKHGGTPDSGTVGALVVGADYRALAVVRSLGRRGIPVWVLRDGNDTLAARSRYARRHLPFPPDRDPEAQVACLLNLAREHQLDGWVLIPSRDGTAALIGNAHARLAERFRLTTPPWDMLRWAYDKRLTYALAERIGLPYPRTWPVSVALDPGVSLQFPVIIKPTVKEESNALTAAKAWRVDDARELTARLPEACQLVDPDVLVIQEVIPRHGADQLSYAALCRSGQPVASLTARRVRQYPADFGRASTYVETIVMPDVEEHAMAFLAECRFDGLVEVEFIRDPRDGTLKLIDVNPRVWGWHGLCGPAGVDFSYLAYRQARSLPIEPTVAQPGVRWLRWATDVPTSLREIVHRELALGPYLRTLVQRHESAIFARDDPGPALAELPMIAGRLMGRRRWRGG
jgi:D-aspartate ligase